MSHVKQIGVGSDAIVDQLMDMARSSALLEMASGIAHELNQPLGAIATFAQAGDRLLNRSEPMVGRALDVFRQISTEALSAGERIRRIRDLFHQSTPELTPMQMPLVVEELRSILEFMAQCANTEQCLMVEAPCPDVSIDKLRIQHVIIALVQNALQACAASDRPRRSQIALRSDRYAVEVSVTDSGPGIADTVRELIFRPFFTTKPGGTGLGLASCRTIIEMHEGTIGFEPVPTGGTRFWFRLPVSESSMSVS